MDPLLLWGLCLLAVAVIIVIVDVFLPSAGVLSVTAVLVAIAGVVCLWRYDTTWGLIGTLLTIVAAPTLFFLGLRVMPHTPLGRRIILGGPATQEQDTLPATDAATEALRELVGQQGEVVTDLRPIGTVRVAGKRYDALSDMGLVRAGSAVKVVAVEDGQVKVRPV
jgi:membrane-bound ClpP family serine protease